MNHLKPIVTAASDQLGIGFHLMEGAPKPAPGDIINFGWNNGIRNQYCLVPHPLLVEEAYECSAPKMTQAAAKKRWWHKVKKRRWAWQAINDMKPYEPLTTRKYIPGMTGIVMASVIVNLETYRQITLGKATSKVHDRNAFKHRWPHFVLCYLTADPAGLERSGQRPGERMLEWLMI